MKSPYVKELQPNQVITATFLVQHKEIRQKKSGEPYLSLVLADRTGEIEAKMWDNAAEVMDTFDRDHFLRVRGLLQIHHNRLQLAVHKLQRQDEDEVDFTDYFPCAERHPDEMLEQLRAQIASVTNVHLRGLLDRIFDDAEVVQSYKIAPAAKSIHHAYLGGLIEHVLSMCALARMAAGHYRNIDVDLLLTGVILHDIGKIYELSYDRSFGYTSDGQLLGHIVIGLLMIDEKAKLVPDFPPRLRKLLEHMILSHHGELEYGSPKVPLFPEALLLHHIDNLDSKMECMRAMLDRDRQLEGNWTTYSASLDRPVLKKNRYLEIEEPVQAEEARKPVQAPAAAAPVNENHTPAAPPAVVPRPAMPAARPSAVSAFAEKLSSALRRDS